MVAAGVEVSEAIVIAAAGVLGGVILDPGMLGVVVHQNTLNNLLNSPTNNPLECFMRDIH